MKILLVEDNSDHRELMRFALTGHDSTWEVEAVEAGEEALRLLLGGEVFDLVFLDYSLPRRDGLEVLEEIRRGEAPPPVVVVTGRGDEQVAVKAMKGGAYDYVVKGEGYLQRLPVVAQRAVEAHQLAVERKRAEKALRESEERLRTVVEASLDAIIAVNVEGRLVLFNGAAQELFQYSEEEALNQSADILLREEIGKIHQERLEKFLKRGVGRCGHIGRRMEKLFCRKDGSPFEAEVSMSGGRLNGLRLVVLAIHDITSRKRDEEVLRQSEEKYRDIFDKTVEGIYRTTPIGYFDILNPAFARICGYASPEEMMGRVTDIANQLYANPEDRLRFQKLIAVEGEVKDFEVQFKHPTKGLVWVSIHSKAIHDEQGNIQYYDGTIEDITKRKQAEEELRRSEENFRHSLDDSPLGVRIVTIEGETIYANRAILDIYGYDSMEDLKTTPVEKRYTPESHADFLIRREKRRQGVDVPSEYAINIIRKDGEVRHLQVIRKEILWNGERQFQVIYQDVTERKQVEQAFSENEQRLHNIINGSPIPTFVIGKDHRVIHWNKALEEMSRIKSKEIVGTCEQWKAFYNKERPCMADLLVDGAVELVPKWYSGKYMKSSFIRDAYEATDFFPVLGEDGKWLRFTAAAIRDSKGMVVAAVETLEDITENRRSEEARRESEGKYRKLIEATRDLVYTTDRKGFLTYMNPTLERTLGYTCDELNGKTFAQIVAPAHIDSVMDVFRRAMRGEYIPVYEVDLVRKDGTRLSVEFNASTLYDNEGKPTGRDGIGRDITERKQAEEELRTSRLQLRALAMRLQQIREEERTMIAREIHDEMGGGLTGLKMDLSWLLRKMGDADPGEARVALMDKIQTSNASIDRMIHLVRRISTDLRPSILDDLGLIAALEWQLSEFTSRTEIPHEFATTFEYVNMAEDTAVAVFRIFQEALTNVVRHARASKVAVVLREGEMSLFGDETLVLEIRDNGRGITEEEIRNSESLGLLGMKERVLTFGGALSIRGEPGGGTALVLKIPRKQGESS